MKTKYDICHTASCVQKLFIVGSLNHVNRHNKGNKFRNLVRVQLTLIKFYPLLKNTLECCTPISL